MTNLTRETAKIFGETASPTGDDPQIGQFGSAKTGTYLGTNDVSTIQSLPAWSNGWIDAVTPSQQFPTLPERTAVDYVQSYHTAYLLQKGVAEWDAGTTYYTGDICKGIGEGKLYVSLTDSNINNALTDSNNWLIFSTGANTNLSNLTATGKDYVINLTNELDWNNAINVSTSTGTRTYTPTIDGVMLLSAFSSGGTASKDVYAYFTLPSGHQVGSQILGTNQAIYNTTYLYVKNNTQITYTLGLGNSSGTLHNEVKAIFIPFKKS